MYNAHYQGYSPPNPPKVKVVGGHGKATIYWTNDAEVSKDVVTTYTDFEGYKIYKSMDNGSTWGNISHKITDDEGVHVGWLPIKQYDLSKEEDESFCILGFEDVNENGSYNEAYSSYNSGTDGNRRTEIGSGSNHKFEDELKELIANFICKKLYRYKRYWNLQCIK